MPASQPRKQSRTGVALDDWPAKRQRLCDLVRGASVEISARDPAAIETLTALLPAGATVYVNFAANDTHHRLVAMAVRLRQAGFRPVPHVAARHLASYTQLNDYLARATGEAGVEQVLVVGGDVDRPVGPFQSSLQILQTDLFSRHGLREVAIAGYPEGHSEIDDPSLRRALLGKLAFLQQAGIAASIVSQFCLEAAPIRDWLQDLRTAGVAAPVRIGLAGPTGIAALARYAVRCGIGASIRSLVRGQTSLARLVVEAGPEPLLWDFVSAAEGMPDMAGLHFFPFGGLQRTGNWMQAMVRGDITPAPDGGGFRCR